MAEISSLQESFGTDRILLVTNLRQERHVDFAVLAFHNASDMKEAEEKLTDHTMSLEMCTLVALPGL